MSPNSPNTPRRPSWATATLATGQNLLSAMLYNRKEYDISEHPTHRTEYQSFRDDILMPPAYDTVVTSDSQPPPLPSQPLAALPKPRKQQQKWPTTATTTNNTTSAAAAVTTPRQHPIAAIQLPPLPRLLGLENLDEWDDMLVRTLRLHNLSAYLTTSIPEPHEEQQQQHHAQWTADRAAICHLIISSLSSDVRDTLCASGYDGAADDDPRTLRDLVLEALPKAAGEDVSFWMGELSHITPSASGLREFALRLQYLRRRLNQAEPQPNDNLVMVMAVLGLARCERYEGLSMSLGRELEAGGLSWGRLMADLAGVYGREVRERRRRGKVLDD